MNNLALFDVVSGDSSPAPLEYPGVCFTPVGLTMPDNLPFDRWQLIMRTLPRVGDAVKWAIGDAINFGEARYGEKYAQAINATGLEYGTLRIRAHISSRFTLLRRRNNVPWWVYQEIAPLPENEQEEVLNWVCQLDEEELSRERVRCRIRGEDPSPLSFREGPLPMNGSNGERTPLPYNPEFPYAHLTPSVIVPSSVREEDAQAAVSALAALPREKQSVAVAALRTAIKKEIRDSEREQEEEATRAILAAEPEQESLEVKTGEWWRLGSHLLFCGDTASPEFRRYAVTADFAFADPPYNADAAAWDSGFVWAHDWLIDAAPIVAVTPGISAIFDFAYKTSMPYKWSHACFIDNGMTRGALGFGNWIYTALFTNGSLHRNAQDVLRISIRTGESGETQHKGRKPSELLNWMIATFTQRGQTVIDPFLGSGTTLFACEAAGRICIGGEMQPGFCAEIISRWEAATGQKAERVEA